VSAARAVGALAVSLARYLVLVPAVQLAQLAVHQVLHRVDLRLHLLLGGLQPVLQFTNERFAAAAVQRRLQSGALASDRHVTSSLTVT